MANPVLTTFLCSDWFFLGQDFAGRTVSMETVQSVYFCFGAKPTNSAFATKIAKKVWKLSFFTLKLPAEAKKIEFFSEISKMDEEDDHFLSASHRKCILLSGTECHIINYLLTELAWAVPRNIGPRSVYCHDLGPIFPSTALALG